MRKNARAVSLSTAVISDAGMPDAASVARGVSSPSQRGPARDQHIHPGAERVGVGANDLGASSKAVQHTQQPAQT